MMWTIDSHFCLYEHGFHLTELSRNLNEVGAGPFSKVNLENGENFDDVLRIMEYNPFDEEYDYKYYAKNFGLVKVEEELEEMSDGEWSDPGLTYEYVGSVAASAPVPEPGTISLLGTGIVGIIGLGRKKMKK